MKKIYISVLLIIAAASGCKKFDEFQKDPNKPTLATPDLLLPTVEQGAFKAVDLGAALATRQMVFTNNVSNNQYYGWTRAEFSTFNDLRQVIRMEAEASRTGKPEYIPLIKFFKAYYAYQLTLVFGDIPYSQALKGEEGNVTPAYDKQEDIFLSILNELKEANALITTTATPVQGDIIFDSNMIKWKKLINTFSLRVLISLSLKENNARLEVKKRFAEIVNNPAQFPIMTGNDDNGQLKYHDQEGNRYRYFSDNDLQTAYYLEETFVDRLKALQDPRLFTFAEKAPKFAALPATDFNAYGGVKGSAPVSDNNNRVVAGEASKIKSRYFNDPVNEPSVAIGYPELQFILAEAAVRGWIANNAATYYENGIRASMLFYKIDADAITNYIRINPFPGAEQLSSIMTQKHLASFLNSGWQAFYDQRRTGFPAFDVSGAGMLNDKKIPKRWMYPESELRYNQKNVSDAIAAQYPQGDNINGLMWLLKAE